MPIINLTTLQDILGGTELIDATVTAYVAKNGARAVRYADDEVIFPAPVVVEIVAGVVEEDFELLTLPAEYYWNLVITTDNKIPLRRTVVVPGNVGPYDFDELVDVDPNTALPNPGTALADAYANLIESYAIRAETALSEIQDLLDEL